MIGDSDKVVYLDANFLVDWSVRKEPELRKRARIFLAILSRSFDFLCFSPLTIDEFWKGIKIELAGRGASYSDEFVFLNLKIFTEKILSHKKMRVVQLQNPQKGIGQALTILKEYALEPRDAFHLAIMRDNSINKIVTRDKDDFIKKQGLMGIQVVEI